MIFNCIFGSLFLAACHKNSKFVPTLVESMKNVRHIDKSFHTKTTWYDKKGVHTKY